MFFFGGQSDEEWNSGNGGPESYWIDKVTSLSICRIAVAVFQTAKYVKHHEVKKAGGSWHCCARRLPPVELETPTSRYGFESRPWPEAVLFHPGMLASLIPIFFEKCH